VSYTLVCVHFIVRSMYVSSCSTPSFSSPSFSSPRTRIFFSAIWTLSLNNFSFYTKFNLKILGGTTGMLSDLCLTLVPVRRLPLKTFSVRAVLVLRQRFWTASTSMLRLDQHIPPSRSHACSHSVSCNYHYERLRVELHKCFSCVMYKFAYLLTYKAVRK